MIKSEGTTEIFKAMAKFQGELTNAKKDTAGHGYKYADLAGCIDVAKPVLASNGLSVTQLLGGETNATRTLTTLLCHESGEFIGSEFVMAEAVLQGGSGKNPAQVLGSAITYMRRYAYAAIIGLAQTDDDAACNTPAKRTSAPKQQSKPQVDIFAGLEAQLETCKSFDEIMVITDSEKFKNWNAGLSADNKKKVAGLVADSQARFVGK